MEDLLYESEPSGQFAGLILLLGLWTFRALVPSFGTVPTVRNDPGSVDIYPAAVECNPNFQGLRSGTESCVTIVDVEGPIRGIRYAQSEPGGSVGRVIAYAGLVVVGLGILGLLVLQSHKTRYSDCLLGGSTVAVLGNYGHCFQGL